MKRSTNFLNIFRIQFICGLTLALIVSSGKAEETDLNERGILKALDEIALFELENLQDWLEIGLDDCQICNISTNYILELSSYAPSKNAEDIDTLWKLINDDLNYDEIDFSALNYFNYIISTLNNDFIAVKYYEENVNYLVGYIFEETELTVKYEILLQNIDYLSETLIIGLEQIQDSLNLSEAESANNKSFLLRTVSKICLSEYLFYCKNNNFDLPKIINEELEIYQSDELLMLKHLIELDQLLKNDFSYEVAYDPVIENILTDIRKIIETNPEEYFYKYYEYLPDKIFSDQYSQLIQEMFVKRNLRFLANYKAINLDMYIYETRNYSENNRYINEELQNDIEKTFYLYASEQIENGFSAKEYDAQISILFAFHNIEFTDLNIAIYEKYAETSDNFFKKSEINVSFILYAMQALSFSRPELLELPLEDFLSIYAEKGNKILNPASAHILGRLIKQTESESTVFLALSRMQSSYLEANPNILSDYSTYFRGETVIKIPIMSDLNSIVTKLIAAEVYFGMITREENLSLIQEIIDIGKKYGIDEILSHEPGFQDYLFNLATIASFEKDYDLINMIVDALGIYSAKSIDGSSIKENISQFIDTHVEIEPEFESMRQNVLYARHINGSIAYHLKDYAEEYFDRCGNIAFVTHMGHSIDPIVNSYIRSMDESEVPVLSELIKCDQYKIFSNRLVLLSGLYNMHVYDRDIILNQEIFEIGSEYISQLKLATDAFLRKGQLPPAIRNSNPLLNRHMYLCSLFYEFKNNGMKYFPNYLTTRQFISRFSEQIIDNNIATCNESILPVLDLIDYNQRTSNILTKNFDFSPETEYIKVTDSFESLGNMIRESSDNTKLNDLSAVYAESILKMNEVTRLVANDNENFKLAFNPSWGDIESLQTHLSDDALLLINPAAVYLIKKNEIFSHSFKGTQFDQLLASTSALLNATIPRNGIPEYPFQLGHEIYETIFGPFTEELSDIKTISIISDTPLYGLPFNILVTSQEEKIFAYEKFNFVKWPSIRSFYASEISLFESNFDDSFLGIGNPQLTGVNQSLRAVNIITDESVQISANLTDYFSPLPETQEELLIIANLYENSELLAGDEATEDRIKDFDFTNYSTVMFSSHGVLSGEIPGLNEPAIVLSSPALSSKNDGILTASEISRLDLSSKLIILSACNSNIDRSLEDYDLNGLSTAFLYAGAKSLLVTNWPVETLSIKELTTETIKYMKGNDSTLNEGLDFAINELRKNPVYDHPAFWGPLSVIGETIH